MIVSGLPYDIGFGQKLFLRCRGHGVPTGIYVKAFKTCKIFLNSYFGCADWYELGYLASSSRKSEKDDNSR